MCGVPASLSMPVLCTLLAAVAMAAAASDVIARSDGSGAPASVGITPGGEHDVPHEAALGSSTGGGDSAHDPSTPNFITASSFDGDELIFAPSCRDSHSFAFLLPPTALARQYAEQATQETHYNTSSTGFRQIYGVDGNPVCATRRAVLAAAEEALRANETASARCAAVVFDVQHTHEGTSATMASTILRRAFSDEERVVIRQVQTVTEETQNPTPTPSAAVAVFTRHGDDHTCVHLAPAEPSVICRQVVEGAILADAEKLVSFINDLCGTLRRPNGTLHQSLHRKLSELASRLQPPTAAGAATAAAASHGSNAASTKDHNGNTAASRSKQRGTPQDSTSRRVSVRPTRECRRVDAANMSPEEFLREVVAKHEPVILSRTIASTWPALQRWTIKYMRDLVGDSIVHVKVAPNGVFEASEPAAWWCSGDNDTRVNSSGSEALPPPKCDDEVAAETLAALPFPRTVMARSATMDIPFSQFARRAWRDGAPRRRRARTPPPPDQLPSAWLSNYIEYASVASYMPMLEPDISDMPLAAHLKRMHTNLWISDGLTLMKAHYDPVDNLLVPVRGRKRLLLHHPYNNSAMYEAPLRMTMYEMASTDGDNEQLTRTWRVPLASLINTPVDIADVDLNEFPAFESTLDEWMLCDARPGEAMYIPSYWWHEPESIPQLDERTADGAPRFGDEDAANAGGMHPGINVAVNFWYEPFFTKPAPCPTCAFEVAPRYHDVVERLLGQHA